MNSRCCGSVSLSVLAAAVILLLIAQLFYLAAGREYARQLHYLRSEQLKLLCVSALAKLSASQPAAGQRQLMNAELYPGPVQALVTAKMEQMADGCVKYLQVTAVCGDETQCLRRSFFALPPEMQQLGRQYRIISSRAVKGSAFLPAGTLYTGTGKINFPKAGAFARQAINELPMDTLRFNGLCRRFYYLSDYHGLTFESGMKIFGEALLAAEGNIIINNGCQFTDRIILLSEEQIIIGDNVRMPQALLLARKGIRIGNNCFLGGALFSEGEIEFTAPVDFVQYENFVAQFSSVYYII